MKVYLVGKNDYPMHVFASEEKAHNWLIEMQEKLGPGSYRTYYWVKEFEVIE